MIVLEYAAPKPPDWKPTFLKNDKIPYGTYILFNLLSDLFETENIEVNSTSFYMRLKDGKNINNIVIINDIFSPSESDLNILLEEVQNGSNVFIAAESFSSVFSDTLNFNISYTWLINSIADSTPITYNFVKKNLKQTTDFNFPEGSYITYCETFDSLHTEILAVAMDTLPIFLKINYGEGNFFINSFPYGFTNYAILENNNHFFASYSLSYLNKDKVIWDEFYKTYKIENSSPIRFILQTKELKAAYFLLITALLLYIFFEGKRKQRIIPVVQPPSNSSLEFTETIAGLYLHSGNHKDIVEKKFTYLLEFLRNKYYIRFNEFSEEKYLQIAEKTKANVKTTQQLFSKYNELYNYKTIHQTQLLEFNKLLENFYKQCS